MRMVVLAAGAWGTALAINFAARHGVCLWAREPDLVAEMQQMRENRRFLPGFRFPERLTVEGQFSRAVREVDLVIVATPIAGLRTTLQDLQKAQVKVPILWVCKGFERGTGRLPHEVLDEVFPGIPNGLLSGPSFAQEVAAGKPTAITLVSRQAALARTLVQELHGGNLRLYAGDDLVGAEVGAAVKNVLAIATGVCDGLQLGLNARAALITRGLAEIARLGVALGGARDTFLGLAGVGDLILTCTGDLSRNRQVGLGLAEGKSLEQILADLGHVAEGVPTAFEVHRLAQRIGVDMPITAAVASLLEGQTSAREAVAQLLARDPRDEGC